MSFYLRAALAGALALIVAVVPVVYFRALYAYHKRLRQVVPGRVYRSGQMTARGLADAVARYHVRTVLNVQDDYPDPDVDLHFWGGGTLKERELCRRLGVRYVHLAPTWSSPGRSPGSGPRSSSSSWPSWTTRPATPS